MAESPENAAAAPAAPPAPAPAPAPAPKPSPPARSGIPPRYDLDAKWDACLDLSIRRVAYSSLAGAFGGLILFRSPTTRWASVALGAGVGIGAAFTECSYIFNGSPPKWSANASTVAAHSEVTAFSLCPYCTVSLLVKIYVQHVHMVDTKLPNMVFIFYFSLL
ncbi:hypothetical protein CFC21_074855 [Triticum aestivum]|uniref:MICOS complex subunit MIC10 n=2 Tax=Triticum aestivum TaxID=4565 RepID=A0A9R1KWQ7_WHEAT|nr:hypothetical protein CFC21_074855 [Triticum aestivum]